MADLDYIKLVLLTERPGARIGRVAAIELSEAERTVATALDWLRATDQAHRWDGLQILSWFACGDTASWRNTFQSLSEIGARTQLRALMRMWRIADSAWEVEPEARVPRFAGFSERRRSLIERIGWRIWDEPGHAELVKYVESNATSIPGVDEFDAFINVSEW